MRRHKNLDIHSDLTDGGSFVLLLFYLNTEERKCSEGWDSGEDRHSTSSQTDAFHELVGKHLLSGKRK